MGSAPFGAVRTGSLCVAIALCGCATESHRVLETQSVESAGNAYNGPRDRLAISNFQNHSPYHQGLFASGHDHLGSQARTILKTHLSQTNRFVLVDRDNMAEAAREAEIAGAGQRLTAASVLVSGEVTEFGRRETGDRELFGIAGRCKSQVAYAKVSLNVVDVATSQVVYSVQGAGEYQLSNREILGTGSTAGYDATLNGKVLNLAILDAVNKLVRDLEAGQWNPVRDE